MKNPKLLASTASRFVAAAATFAGLMGVSTSANAALVAAICDDAACIGGGDTIVTDQGVGDNFPGSAVLGQVNTGALNVGGFVITTNITQSKPLLGSAASPQMALTFSATTQNSAAHTVYLYAADTGFTTGGIATLTLGGTQGPGSGNSVEGGIWGGTSNSSFDLSNPIATTGPVGANPFTVTLTDALNNTSATFGLTLGVRISRSEAGTTSGALNGSITPVPLPAAGWLLCSGLAGIGAMVRRRRASSSKA
jgi:hypothetical protein